MLMPAAARGRNASHAPQPGPPHAAAGFSLTRQHPDTIRAPASLPATVGRFVLLCHPSKQTPPSLGEVPEWLKGTDCKSVGYAYAGSNPALSTTIRRLRPSNQKTPSMAAFAIKAEVRDTRGKTFTFPDQKTMYGGKSIRPGDAIFVFAREKEGGAGLIACGVVTTAKPTPKRPSVARQTPRVSVSIRRMLLEKSQLGRNRLKQFTDWQDGKPETELNFKLYRQATNKIVGISDETASFLSSFF
jgi:hypothetical protein